MLWQLSVLLIFQRTRSLLSSLSLAPEANSVSAAVFPRERSMINCNTTECNPLNINGAGPFAFEMLDSSHGMYERPTQWTCHAYGESQQNISLQPNCPECGHTVCGMSCILGSVLVPRIIYTSDLNQTIAYWAKPEPLWLSLNSNSSRNGRTGAGLVTKWSFHWHAYLCGSGNYRSIEYLLSKPVVPARIGACG